MINWKALAIAVGESILGAWKVIGATGLFTFGLWVAITTVPFWVFALFFLVHFLLDFFSRTLITEKDEEEDEEEEIKQGRNSVAPLEFDIDEFRALLSKSIKDIESQEEEDEEGE